MWVWLVLKSFIKIMGVSIWPKAKDLQNEVNITNTKSLHYQIQASA